MRYQSKPPIGKPFGAARKGGRPKGSLNKATIEIKEAARLLLEDPVYQASLKARLEAGTAGAVEPLLYHYVYGKPKDTIEHQLPMRPVVIDQLQPGELLERKRDDD